MLTYILIAIAIVVALLTIVVATRPADFRYQRSATMNASPPEVFAQVNNFHHWQEWSPWAKRDPKAMTSYDGPTEGEGAKFAWKGNSEVGEGNMMIIESTPHKLIAIRLEFLSPMKAINTAEFKFTSLGEKTEVSWSMFGKNNFMGKAFGMIVDCDKMIGKDFEQGLANLRSIVESLPSAPVKSH